MTRSQWSRAALTTVVQAAGQLSRVELNSVDAPLINGRLSYVQLGTPSLLVASAGIDKLNLEPWHQVDLAGTYTGGTAASVSWRQISGPTVTLSATNTAAVTYEAPGTVAGTTLKFGFTATNAGGPSVEAIVQHIVYPCTERAIVGGIEVPLRILAVTS